MNTDKVDALLERLSQAHGIDHLRTHIDEVVRPAEAVAAILAGSGDVLDALVVTMLEVMQRASGEQRVLDKAIEFYGDSTCFRQSLGWRCIVVRMDEARRLVKQTSAKTPGRRREAHRELQHRGLA